MMRFISWNVAGFRAALKKGFEDFFQKIDADVIALQEVKATMEEIPFHPDGYTCYLNVAERKGYSGTLIYTKEKPLFVTYGMNEKRHDHEGRLITLEYPNFYFINTYVPNVKRDLSRMEDRMDWEETFLRYIKTLEKMKPVVISGDFNVAHQPVDIRNSKENEGNAGYTQQEREKFTHLLDQNMIDTYRHFHPSEKDIYSWWSYRYGVRERNIGWRIDYFIISERLLSNVVKTDVLMDVMGSDHCPILLELNFKKMS